MLKLTDLNSYAEAQREFSIPRLWDLLDGDEDQLNIAHECVDRHAASGRIAVRLAHASGEDEAIGFAELSKDSSRFANWLIARGVASGDRVAVMLEPSRAFYVAMFGAIKAGAIAVPLFTLFGPDGLRLRVDDCSPKLLITNAEKAPIAREVEGLDVVEADAAFFAELAAQPATFTPRTKSRDIAIFQYTSGTTRLIPEAVKHSHRSIVYLLAATLYGTGARPGDVFFCPSSIAWGHGLWHGTLAPLCLGITTGTISGKFDPLRFCKALSDYGVTTVSAAPTHYRMARNSGAAEKFSYAIRKVSYTGEPMDPATDDFIRQVFGAAPCSMYGTTEVGAVLVCFPGAPDFEVKPGSLGKAIPGSKVAVHDAAGAPCAPGVMGEIVVWRKDSWLPTKDLGHTDEDGYFFYGGRSDDVIISAGWTMSAIEIEGVLLKHPKVLEAAVVGVPDALRGLIPKAYVVTSQPGDPALALELQDFTRQRLSQHEYPRAVAFVDELPKTPAGKINRKILREEAARAAAA